MAFPKTVQITWNANPPVDAVTGYTVKVNGAVVGTTTGLSQSFSVPAPGTYVADVIATNTFGDGPVGSATLVAALPGVVANVAFVVI